MSNYRQTFERGLSIRELCEVQSPSGDCIAMLELIGEYCEVAGWEYEMDGLGNMCITNGAGPWPCFVAHADTVHDKVKKRKVVQVGDWLTAWDLTDGEQVGVGGDDRCGVWLGMEMLARLPSCRVIITVDEEVGAVGANALPLEWLEGCRYMMQADRRGVVDMITQACGLPLASSKFVRRVSGAFGKIGMSECRTGSLTDVYALVQRGAGLCALNLAAGYYHAHTDRETIFLPHLGRLADTVEKLVADLGPKIWRFTPPAPPPRSNVAYGRSSREWYYPVAKKGCTCWGCGGSEPVWNGRCSFCGVMR